MNLIIFILTILECAIVGACISCIAGFAPAWNLPALVVAALVLPAFAAGMLVGMKP